MEQVVDESSGCKPENDIMSVGKEDSTGEHEAAAAGRDALKTPNPATLVESQLLAKEPQTSGLLTTSIHPQHPLIPQVSPIPHIHVIQGKHGLHVGTGELSSVHRVPFSDIPGPAEPRATSREQSKSSIVRPGEHNSIGGFTPPVHTTVDPALSSAPKVARLRERPSASNQAEDDSPLCSEVLHAPRVGYRQQNVIGVRPEYGKSSYEGVSSQPGWLGSPPDNKQAQVLPQVLAKEEPKLEVDAQVEEKWARDPDPQCNVQQENLSHIPGAINTNLQPVSSLERLGVKPGKRVLIRPKEWAGEVVWAKLARDPWWPAQVLGENDPFIPQDADPPRLGAVPVRFFGTYDFAWIETQRSLTPFLNSFQDRSSAVELKEFIIGVNEALELQHTGRLPQGFADAMEDAKPVPNPRGKSKPKPLKDSGGKRQLDLVCPGKVPAAGRKDKVMRFLGLAPPNGSPYATTRAVNPNLLLLSQTGDAYHCP